MLPPRFSGRSLPLHLERNDGVTHPQGNLGKYRAPGNVEVPWVLVKLGFHNRAQEGEQLGM